MNRVDAAVSAEDDLTVSATTATQIDSVANLALDVKDPGGPIAVGDDAIYEIHIKNRGTKDAEGIETIGYFSRGIEPVGAEGASNKISAGQVTFQSINAIPPGGEIVLKVHAKAEVPGNHVFPRGSALQDARNPLGKRRQHHVLPRPSDERPDGAGGSKSERRRAEFRPAEKVGVKWAVDVLVNVAVSSDRLPSTAPLTPITDSSSYSIF